MDLPVRPKPCNLHKPRIRIVEKRHTVYESWQPEFAAQINAAGQIIAVPTGNYTYGMTYAQLSGAIKYAPNGASGRAERAARQGLTP